MGHPGSIASTVLALLVAVGGADLSAQEATDGRSSRNMELVSHIPLGGARPTSGAYSSGFEGLGRRTADIEIEQETDRPYAYVASRFSPSGFYVIDLRDPANARVLYHWVIEDPMLHQGSGALDCKYFKHDGRTYYVQSFQFGQGGPDGDLGAIVFDVTDLPDDPPEEVARIQGAATRGGFHNIFMYKHSDGRPLLFATAGDSAHVYDMARVVEGEPGLVTRLTTPPWVEEEYGRSGYHDFFVGFHPPSQQDRFYGAGVGGYHVFDVTDPLDPKHLASVQSAAVRYGHTATPTPDGRYLVTEVEYRTAPLRIFDLKPALDGDVDRVRTAVGAWTANWRNYAHNHEVRWPFVFVAAFDDGLQVFNMRDPGRPYTVGYYDTWTGPDGELANPKTDFQGAWGVDVRDADGLIVVSDFTTGFWAFRMEAFEGWNGDGWGVPNISSAQDWEDGPHGVQPGGAVPAPEDGDDGGDDEGDAAMEAS